MKNELPIHHRPQWKSKLGFILATIGSAVGLGNIWRFPYMCYENGGFTFLVPYLTALLVVGIPLMILEVGMGHKFRGSAPVCFADTDRRWEWLGWWQVIFVMFGIVLYYSVVISWCVNYFTFSFTGAWGSDPDTFFLGEFLGVSSGGPFDVGNIQSKLLLALFLVWFVQWLICFNGVEKGLERANKIFMPLLFILTLFITFFSFTLPGAWDGVRAYIFPGDMSVVAEKLTDMKVWTSAFSQIFFTLSLGFGIIMAYASYLPRKTDIVKDSLIVCVANSIFSIVAGFAVFSVLGFMAAEQGVAISEVVTKSIGLAFVAFPKAISMMPASKLFGSVFFAMLVVAGISSAISIIEAFTSAIIDKFAYSRKTVVSFVCVFGFLGSLLFVTNAGLLWLDIVDHFLTNYGLVLGAVFECVLAGWLLRAHVLRAHINSVSDVRLIKFWDISVMYIAPAVLVIILLQSLITEFTSAYEGYSVVSLIVIGRDWLMYTFCAALVVSSHPWKTIIEKK